MREKRFCKHCSYWKGLLWKSYFGLLWSNKSRYKKHTLCHILSHNATNKVSIVRNKVTIVKKGCSCEISEIYSPVVRYKVTIIITIMQNISNLSYEATLWNIRFKWIKRQKSSMLQHDVQLHCHLDSISLFCKEEKENAVGSHVPWALSVWGESSASMSQTGFWGVFFVAEHCRWLWFFEKTWWLHHVVALG